MILRSITRLKNRPSFPLVSRYFYYIYLLNSNYTCRFLGTQGLWYSSMSTTVYMFRSKRT